MTIVVSGYALPRINTYAGAPVAYGLTLKAGTPITPQTIIDASLQVWYAIDYRIKRRRPITPEEFAMLRQFIEVRDRVKRKYLKDQRELVALNKIGEIRVDSFRVRLPYKGDYSGLVPVKNATGNRNRTKVGATLRRDGSQREGTPGRNGGRLRKPVRVHQTRATRA